MDDMKKLAEKYSAALETIKEVKSRLTGVIIKYLLLNSSELKKCSELAISENLGVPRGTIRKVLQDLSQELALEYEDLDTIKPYIVKSIGYSVDRGYVSFTKDELQEILKVKEVQTQEFAGYVHYHTGVSQKVDDKPLTRYLTPGAAKCYETFVGRFYSYLHAAEVNEKLQKAYDPETQKQLGLLMPELSTFRIATDFRFLSPLPVWSSSELILLGPEATPQDLKESVKKKWEQEIEFVLDRLETFANNLIELGYKGTTKKLGEPKIKIDYYSGADYPPIITEEFRKEYLWATTMALRNGCRIAEKLGVEKNLIERAMRRSDILDKAVEKEYEGKEQQGLLEDWYGKRT